MRAARWVGIGAIAVGLATVGLHPSSAFAGPDPQKLHNAADSFEAGSTAFQAGKFEEAAGHFEAADDAVPGAKALRLAIRARSEAGQGSRAATLAALALDLYPGDAETAKIANAALDRFGKSLHKLKVSCVSPCLLAAQSRAVHGQANTRWTVYLDPGKQAVGASFLGNLTAPDKTVVAVEGGTGELRFEPPSDASKQTPTSPAHPDGPQTTEPVTPPEKHFGAHPALFFVSLAATVGLGATTIWSGIDTKNNPGTEKVKHDCAGKGTDCPAYKEGLSHQLRTNVLIGVTSGTAALTLVIGAFLTNWHGSDKPAESESKATASRANHGPFRVSEVKLWVDLPSATRGALDGPPATGVAGIQGRF